MKTNTKLSKEFCFGSYSIRCMTKKDENLMQIIYSDLKTRVFGFGREVTLEHAIKFFTPEDINHNHFLFFQNNNFIGRAVLYPTSDGTAASFGIAVNPAYQGHGHGYQIGQFILNKAFNNPSVQKLSGTALRFNIPSQKLMQKLGMNPNGIHPKKELFQDYDTHSLAFSIDRDSYLKGNEQKGAKHPDSISLEDLVFRDAQSIRASDKDSLINVMKFKRKELFIKLELDYPLKKLSLYASATALSAAEVIESASLLRYFFEEIFNPLFPYNNNATLDNMSASLPNDDIFWIASHFSLTSLAYFSLPHYNPTFSFKKKLLISISSSIGYASKLYIHNNQKILAEERIFNKLSSQMDISKSDISFLDDCLSEVALSSATAFLFSLPAALSFTPTGLTYSIVSTLSSTATSAVSCAYTNKKIISPNESSISGKVLPYVADASMAFYLVNKISMPSLYFLPEIASSMKHASFILGSIVSTDQIAKALVELTPNEVFEYLDSFFSFHNELSVSTEL